MIPMLSSVALSSFIILCSGTRTSFATSNHTDNTIVSQPISSEHQLKRRLERNKKQLKKHPLETPGEAQLNFEPRGEAAESEQQQKMKHEGMAANHEEPLNRKQLRKKAAAEAAAGGHVTDPITSNQQRKNDEAVILEMMKTNLSNPAAHPVEIADALTNTHTTATTTTDTTSLTRFNRFDFDKKSKSSKNGKDGKSSKSKGGKSSKSSKGAKMAKSTTAKPIQQPTAKPTRDSSYAPTPAPPPGATYYTSFEKPNFPLDYPEWEVAGHSAVHEKSWYQTNEEAASGIYSIRTPDLGSHGGMYSSARVSLHTNPNWGRGHIHFSILANNDFTFPNEVVQWYVGEEKVGSLKEGTSDWKTVQIFLEHGGPMVSWIYKFNPKKKSHAPPSNGVAYIDDVYFIPSDQTLKPTHSPTRLARPTRNPTDSTSYFPTEEPTWSPTLNPTFFPTLHPTSVPTLSPTFLTPDPTASPVFSPFPTSSPIESPTKSPSVPTVSPTFIPSASPTSGKPTAFPTESPSFFPSRSPKPTFFPSRSPSVSPTADPTRSPIQGTTPPTTSPSFSPTIQPTEVPTEAPTEVPTEVPTEFPTNFPTSSPTITPGLPTRSPASPTESPSINPTLNPNPSPTLVPTSSPSITPGLPTKSPLTPKPTASPTESPSFYPTYFPTEPVTSYFPTFSPSHAPSKPGNNLECPSTLDEIQEIDTRTKLYYAVVPSEPADANNGILCARLEVVGEQWVAFGISEDGMMVGSEAVIGTPTDGLVQKYDMNDQSPDAVVPMEESRQTLTGTSLIQEGGMTKMTFTKLLVEPGEIPILEEGKNTFLYAYGSIDLFGYHGTGRGSFTLDFSGSTGPATIAPTSTPASSIYYKGFEQDTFPDPPEWTTTNNDNAELVWERSTQKANSGVYSLRSPALENEAATPASSKATFTTDADWSAGQLRFSVLSSTQMPIDNVQYFVDGELRGVELELKTEFEARTIQLGPGQHTIDFVYNFNPLSIPSNSIPPPQAYPDRIGAAFIDDVYFVPDNAPPTGPTTIAPTSTPAGSTYYRGFENPNFPQFYPEWSTTNLDNADLVWDITDEESNSGVYSMRSPVLDTEEKTQARSTLTLTSDSNGPAGTFHFSVFAGIALPFDRFDVFIDGFVRTTVTTPMTEFEERSIQVGPGGHTIEFVYRFNPNNIPPQGFPPPGVIPNYIGVVYIDDVYFVPF